MSDRQSNSEYIDISEKGCHNMDVEKVRLFSIEKTSELLGLSRSAVYQLVNSGELPAIKITSRTMIRLTDLTVFVNSRERYKGCLNEL